MFFFAGNGCPKMLAANVFGMSADYLITSGVEKSLSESASAPGSELVHRLEKGSISGGTRLLVPVQLSCPMLMMA